MKTLITLITVIMFLSSSGQAKEKIKTLSLDQAQKIGQKADAYGRTKKWKLSIAVIGTDGGLLYFQRNQEAFIGSADAAIQKAQSSHSFQRPTSSFAEAVQKNGRVGLVGVKNVIALEGGVPIVIDGVHVGAIGVSGARSLEDEEAAKAALAETE